MVKPQSEQLTQPEKRPSRKSDPVGKVTMCGIAGAVSIERNAVPRLGRVLAAMSRAIEHRGPDGHGSWIAPAKNCGLAHRRLAIIDLTPSGHQPMVAPNGSVISY